MDKYILIACLNNFAKSNVFYPNQLDEFISNIRVAGWYLFLYSL